MAANKFDCQRQYEEYLKIHDILLESENIKLRSVVKLAGIIQVSWQKVFQS